ncbi:hypothetical protein Ancab_017969 [Ancistrocladus abbreviatus]
MQSMGSYLCRPVTEVWMIGLCSCSNARKVEILMANVCFSASLISCYFLSCFGVFHLFSPPFSPLNFFWVWDGLGSGGFGDVVHESQSSVIHLLYRLVFHLLTTQVSSLL